MGEWRSSAHTQFDGNSKQSRPWMFGLLGGCPVNQPGSLTGFWAKSCCSRTPVHKRITYIPDENVKTCCKDEQT